MKKLFDFLKAYIQANLPEYKTIRVWREQYDRSNHDRDENAFRYPAVFIEFITDNYANYALGYRDVDMIIRFHLGFESYWLEKDLDLEAIDKFDSFMFRFRGNENDPVHFTSLQKSADSDTPNDDNVNLIVVDYVTKYREMSSYEEGITLAPIGLDLDLDVEGAFLPCGLQEELQGGIGDCTEPLTGIFDFTFDNTFG